MQVCNATTPAQFFHLLRRQMYGGADRRGLRKPLVVFTPKSLLRHHKVVSTAAEFTHGHFSAVIGDQNGVSPDRVSRLLFCSGKVYYDLLAAREQKDTWNAGIVRLEQLYPWPQEEIETILWRYPSSTELVWVQEEPRNMGAYLFIRDKLEALLAKDKSRRTLNYAGRPEAASTATGSAKRHAQEQTALIEDAFTSGFSRPRRYRVVAKRKKPDSGD